VSIAELLKNTLTYKILSKYSYDYKTKTLFENWKNNNWIETEYINFNEIEKIKVEIENIDFYDSKSTIWGDSVKNAFVYIKKCN
jgi:hypothetical protein